MSNSGPAPFAKRNSGFGWKMSGPGYCITVCADSGWPMSPRAMARRAVWTPWPSTVSGATPTETSGLWQTPGGRDRSPGRH